MIAASPFEVGDIAPLKMYRLGLEIVPSCRLAAAVQAPDEHDPGSSSNQVVTVRPPWPPTVCWVHTASAPTARGSLRCTAWVRRPSNASMFGFPPGCGTWKSTPADSWSHGVIGMSPSATRHGGVPHAPTADGLTCQTPTNVVSTATT